MGTIFQSLQLHLPLPIWGKNFLSDALSQLPQYNSNWEIVNSIIPSKQIATHTIIRAQSKANPKVADNLTQVLQAALVQDDWFVQMSNLTLHDSLTWVGTTVYVPASKNGVDPATQPRLQNGWALWICQNPTPGEMSIQPWPTPLLLGRRFQWTLFGANSSGNTVIWVVTDLFSKQVHFVAYPKIPLVQNLAKLSVQHIYWLHGTPTKIISDRNLYFDSFTYNCAARSFSKDMLKHCCYINYQQDNWSERLPFIQVAYNNAIHSSTVLLPFWIATGQDFITMLKPNSKQHSKTQPQLKFLQYTWPVVQKALEGTREFHKEIAPEGIQSWRQKCFSPPSTYSPDNSQRNWNQYIYIYIIFLFIHFS